MKKILLVEDDQELLNSLELALEEEGYEILRAEDGQSALNMAHSAKPNLILLDIMLPGVNGIEVCRVLKSDPQFKAVPIIMLTALGDTDSIVRAFSVKAADYVAKPFNLAELLARIKSHLRMEELYDLVKSEEEEKSNLLDFSRAISSTVDPHETLYTIVSRISEIIDVKRCSIIYVDILCEKGYVMASHDSKEVNYLEVVLSKYPEIQRVMETGDPVIINDVLQDPILHNVRDILSLIDIKSIMAFPILFKENPIGTLILRTSRRETPFSDREIRFCGLISHLAGTPLRNAYLFKILNTEKEHEKEKRLEAEAKRENAQKYANNLIDSSLDIIISTDRDRNIVEFNHAAQESFGYAPEEILGKTPQTLYADPAEGRKVAEELRTSGRFIGEITNRRKNGETFPAFLSASELKDSEGRTLGVMGISRDITEQKKAEEEIRKAKDEAEEATKLKDKFVSLMAHDLRSPFTTILGLLKMSLDDTDSPLPPKHRDILERVTKQGKKVVAMIKDLLDVSRLKTSSVKPKPAFLDARFVGLTILIDFKFQAEKKGVRLSCDIPEQTRIYTDLDLFSQVINNLVSNAIKFSRPGGQVTLFVPPGEEAAIAVKDTGVGIQEERHETLFHYEVTKSTTGTAGETGSGLGLPLCRDIMEALGGKLEFESSPGEGSVFYARLPKTHPIILVVDDDEGIRSFLKDILQGLDREIQEAENGMSALEKLAESTPHLIITNINMPVSNGFDLLETLRDTPGLKDIPVIALTADTTGATREKALRLGANDFVTKPIERYSFIPKVRKYVG